MPPIAAPLLPASLVEGYSLVGELEGVQRPRAVSRVVRVSLSRCRMIRFTLVRAEAAVDAQGRKWRLAQVYRGQVCAMCRKPIPLHGFVYKPATASIGHLRVHTACARGMVEQAKGFIEAYLEI